MKKKTISVPQSDGSVQYYQCLVMIYGFKPAVHIVTKLIMSLSLSFIGLAFVFLFTLMMADV